MLTTSARSALDVSPIDNQLFGEQYLNKMKDAVAADRLIRNCTTLNATPAKSNTTSKGRPPFQQKSSSQGNARAFANKSTSRRGVKAHSQSTRHRSSSQAPSAPPIEVITAGRLANFLDAWLDLTDDIVVLSAISGYKIPFVEIPPPSPYIREPCLSKSEHMLCAVELERLICKGAISQVTFSPDQFLSLYFLIDKSSGEKNLS